MPLTEFRTLDDLNTASAEFAKTLIGSTQAIRFTGWKPQQGCSGLVAQWLDWRAERYYYVNLPGMQHGWYERGKEFDIGNQRLEYEDSWSRVESLIKFGYDLLMVPRV